MKRLLLALILCCVPATVMATDYSSSSYTVRDSVIGGGGGESTSTSFSSQGQVGDTANGLSSSSGYAGAGGSEGYDSTAPPAGVVSDGLGADIDGQTDMDNMSANWTGFTDPESGTLRFEYQLHRDYDGKCYDTRSDSWETCSYWVSTGITPNYTLSNVALGLRTSIGYVTCVRAVNGEGFTGGTSCSDGIQISPNTTLTFDAFSVALPHLSGGNSWNGVGTSIISVNTNAAFGYTIYGAKLIPLQLTTDAGITISDLSDGGCSGSAVSWPGATNFGFSSSDDIDSDKFNGGGIKFCAFPTKVGADIGLALADRDGVLIGDTINSDYTITYRTQVSSSQTAGIYRTTILYTLVPTY